MTVCNKEHFKDEIYSIIDKHGQSKTSVLSILRDVQEKYRYISPVAMQIIADKLKMHAIEVQDTATFYHFLSTKKLGKFVISLCQTAPCKLAGTNDIASRLETELGIKFGETTPDGMFTLQLTNCIGMCDQAPAFLINQKPYTKVKVEDIAKILQDCRDQFCCCQKFDQIQSNIKNKFTFDEIEYADCLKQASKKSPQEIIEEITNSKLRGCGGAGFPTGLKLKLTAQYSDSPKYVVCNADEGEPGTFKDRELFTNYAELVFSGMAIAGYAIGAEKSFLYLRGEYEYMKANLEQILQKLKGEKLFDRFSIEIKFGAGAYVCGEETALLESLEGKRGEPRNRPPFPVEGGYLGKPTVLSNVETFARIASIMSKGAKWFAKVGTEKSAGYKLFSISGDCKKPGVYEFPMGISINEMLKTVGGEDAKAIQCGGAGGRCIPKSEFDRKIAFEDAPPGGSIMVFGPERDMLCVLHNFLEFFVEESCGQCTPCREGVSKLLHGVELLKQGACSQTYLDELISLADTMQIASKCGLGQSAPNTFLDIVKHFKSEIFSNKSCACNKH